VLWLAASCTRKMPFGMARCFISKQLPKANSSCQANCVPHDQCCQGRNLTIMLPGELLTSDFVIIAAAYAGTEDGHIHKCSTSYSEQYLESYSGHIGPVYALQWSPFAPNLFLSCSGDWTIRMWQVSALSVMFLYNQRHQLSAGLCTAHNCRCCRNAGACYAMHYNA
jgi:WD40 repeat protein